MFHEKCNYISSAWLSFFIRGGEGTGDCIFKKGQPPPLLFFKQVRKVRLLGHFLLTSLTVLTVNYSRFPTKEIKIKVGVLLSRNKTFPTLVQQLDMLKENSSDCVSTLRRCLWILKSKMSVFSFCLILADLCLKHFQPYWFLRIEILKSFLFSSALQVTELYGAQCAWNCKRCVYCL